jgi:hypothetical protein
VVVEVGESVGVAVAVGVGGGVALGESVGDGSSVTVGRLVSVCAGSVDGSPGEQAVNAIRRTVKVTAYILIVI